HAAPARHEDAGVLRLVEDRTRAVALDVHPGRLEADGPSLAGDDRRDAELLGVERESPLLVVRGERVEETTGAAGERRTVVEVGHQLLEIGEVEDAVLVVVPGDEADAAGGLERLEVAQEDRVGLARR